MKSESAVRHMIQDTAPHTWGALGPEAEVVIDAQPNAPSSLPFVAQVRAANAFKGSLTDKSLDTCNVIIARHVQESRVLYGPSLSSYISPLLSAWFRCNLRTSSCTPASTFASPPPTARRNLAL